MNQTYQDKDAHLSLAGQYISLPIVLVPLMNKLIISRHNNAD
jgi:hypothetical protein